MHLVAPRSWWLLKYLLQRLMESFIFKFKGNKTLSRQVGAVKKTFRIAFCFGLYLQIKANEIIFFLTIASNLDILLSRLCKYGIFVNCRNMQNTAYTKKASKLLKRLNIKFLPYALTSHLN